MIFAYLYNFPSPKTIMNFSSLFQIHITSRVYSVHSFLLVFPLPSKLVTCNLYFIYMIINAK